MIPDLIKRFQKLVDIENNPKIVSVPPLDIYAELAQDWFHTPVATSDQRQFIMKKLKVELDRQEMFEAMHRKFGQSP